MNASASNSNMSTIIRNWLGPILFLIPLIYYYFFYPAHYPVGTVTAFGWMAKHVYVDFWSTGSEGGHYWMIPFICVYMVWYKREEIAKIPKQTSFHGLWLLAIGLFLAIFSVRIHQGRMPMIALPFLLSGMVWYFWGRKTAFKTAFPIFFFLFSIPLPGGIQGVTVPLQLIATQAGHWGAALFGVETIVEGTNIVSATGNWDAYSIAGGCSGLRSLSALIIISFAWAYLADKLALWKRVILALSAIPIAVVGNAFRLISIFVFAEYINPAFAGKTWHDWSGLLFFFPISLLALSLLHGLLAGEVPFLKRRKVIITNAKGKEEA